MCVCGGVYSGCVESVVMYVCVGLCVVDALRV